MNRFADLYGTLFRTAFLGQIQYRASGVIWMIGGILQPVIFLVVWTAAAEAQDGAIEGITPERFAAYYIAFMLVDHLTFSWIMHVFQYRIQSGYLSFELLRPIHPIHADINDNVAYKLIMMAIMAPAMIVLVLLFEPAFVFDPVSLALFLPGLVLAFLTRFLLDWTIALAAFWTTRTLAINEAYFALRIFTSGQVAPLALLPDWLASVALALPFYWTTGFLAELLIGEKGAGVAIEGMTIQAVWLLVSFVLLRVLWRLAIRSFSAVGS